MPYRTEADLRAALDRGQLVETERLDLKQELPPATDRGTRALAADLAALALGGGEVIVGVDEGPPVALTPIVLAGQRERVEQIARHRVDPPVACTVSEIPSEMAGAGHGYLVITVPASPEAPHAVNEAFYGRFGTTNSRLSAAEVRRHMRGTAETGPSIGDLLDRWIAADPIPEEERQQAHLFVVARPLDAEREMLQDAVGTEWESWTRREVIDGRPRLDNAWSPDFGSLHRLDRVPDGWIASSEGRTERITDRLRESHLLVVEFGEDGSIRLFSARASDHTPEARVAIELIIGGLVRRALETCVAVTEATGYQGRWDVGVAVNHLAGTVSHFRLKNWWVDREDTPTYPDDEYRRTWSGTTSELRQDVDAVVERLVGPLNRTLSEGRAPLPRVPRPPAEEPEPD